MTATWTNWLLMSFFIVAVIGFIIFFAIVGIRKEPFEFEKRDNNKNESVSGKE